MSDRKPREYALWPCEHGGLVVEAYWVPPGHACATCGAHPVNVREVPGPWEDLAAAIERVGEAAFFAAVQRYLRWCVVIREEPAVEGLVRALRGAGEKDDG